MQLKRWSRFGIRTKILMAFLVLALSLLTLTGSIAFINMNRVNDLTLKNINALGDQAVNDSTTAVEELGREIIKQKAIDVAEQVRIYIKSHPDMTVVDLQKDEEFQRIAIQLVGETGYTSIMDTDTGYFYFHPQERLVNTDTQVFATTLPAVWEILNGTIGKYKDSDGYYDWEEADGSIRQKYMALTVINRKTADNKSLFVAATTYMDEFSKPIVEIEDRINSITEEIRNCTDEQANYMKKFFIGSIFGILIIASAIAFLLSKTITKPIIALAKSSDAISRGDFEQQVVVNTKDEIGKLADSFNTMALKLKQSHDKLEQKVTERTKELAFANEKLEEKYNELKEAEVKLQRDITERKRMEEALRESEEKYRAIIDNTFDMIYSANSEGVLTYLSPQVSAYGYSPEEGIGHILLEFIHPEDRDHVLNNFQKSIRTGEQFPTHFRFVKKDGGIRYAEEIGSVIMDGDNIVGITGVIRDITERKKAEEEIKRAKEFSENLIQESPTAILSTDSNGNVVVINKSAEDLLGYKYDELVGKPLSMAISGQHDLEMADKKDFSLNFVKKDGTEIPISVSTSVQLFKGEQRGLIVTLKDLSELRGLLITPVSEVGVEAEKEYQLEQGSMYIVEEEKPEKSFDVFHDLVKQGSQGLYISRQNPARIKEKYQLEKTPNIWLTRTKIPEGNCISPDELAKLYKTTENFIRQADDGVIFFEGLEYLVAQNGFQPVLKFIQSLNDVIMVHPSRLIVSVDPLTLDTKELHIFRRDMKAIP